MGDCIGVVQYTYVSEVTMGFWMEMKLLSSAQFKSAYFALPAQVSTSTEMKTIAVCVRHANTDMCRHIYTRVRRDIQVEYTSLAFWLLLRHTNRRALHIKLLHQECGCGDATSTTVLTNNNHRESSPLAHTHANKSKTKDILDLIGAC